nr:MAG TPA: hypothetical protein [Caudoviricetes sp.]
MPHTAMVKQGEELHCFAMAMHRIELRGSSVEMN